MTVPAPPADAALIAAQLEAAPGLGRLRALLPVDVEAGPDTLTAVLEEAAKFATARLAPFNAEADRAGCRLQDGRVKTAPGHREAWRDFVEAGWLGIAQPPEHGGAGLPLIALAACQEIFDRAGVAFGMAPTGVRSAARLIGAHADVATKAEWLPRLLAGDWGATICISEPQAGSDVGRILTLASPRPDGDWEITGEKIWISYGDHDLTDRIGHCLLARTPDAAPGGAGLSLFLVPDTLDDGSRNAIVVRRIEDKLGLHGSPTCSLGFEGARGRLIGTVGRGLAQMFTMIAAMRLMVSVQGVGIASGAADIALAYAEERRQGGPADAPAVPIAEHADVRRMLLGMQSRVQVVRALAFAAAVQADLGALESDPEARDDAQALAAWLLPIAKTYAAETGFDVASEAIQVMGGAGYVNDWPVEQMLRDSRVLAIFEGTSGMHALDLLHRRLGRDQGRGMRAFLALARADITGLGGQVGGEATGALERTLGLFEDAAARLAGRADAEAGAYPLLKLAALAATGWTALRLAATDASTPIGARLTAAGRYWLSDLEPRAALEHALALADPKRLDLFDSIRPPR